MGEGKNLRPSYLKSDPKANRFMLEIDGILVAVGDPEIQIMARHEGTAPQHPIASGRLAGRLIASFNAAAHVLETIAAPSPSVARHIV